MEFAYHNGEILNRIYIDPACNYITMSKGFDPPGLTENSVKLLVTKINLFTEKEGKFQTKEYIIRYSKNDLYLYDLYHNLLAIYKFSKFVKQEINVNSINQNENETITTFLLKKNYFIKLYKSKIDQNCFIYNNGIKEAVVKIQGLGEDVVYTTEKNNILQIITVPKAFRHNKWNGCPISKI